MKSQIKLKLPATLDLGTVLPGHYGQSRLPLFCSEPSFLSFSFPYKSSANGFFIVKEGSSDCLQSLNIVLKPNKKSSIFIGCHPKQVSQSTELRGELIVTEETKEHKIKLHFRIQVPHVLCKKILQDTTSNMKLIRLVINKAVTSDVRIPLFNPEDYELQFTTGVLVKQSISDRENPFVLKTNQSQIKAQPKQQFFVFMSIQTNIGYKNDPKGLKKTVFRNVLKLSTNSTLTWYLPLEIIVVFVKQPQFKSDQ